MSKTLTIVRAYLNLPKPDAIRGRPVKLTNHYTFSEAAAKYKALIKTRIYARVTMDCYEGSKWVMGEWWERGVTEVSDHRGGASL